MLAASVVALSLAILGVLMGWLAKRDRDSVHDRLAAAAEERGRLLSLIEAERGKQSFLADAKQSLSETFAAVSVGALQANSHAFLDLARASLGEFQQAARTDLEIRQRSIDDVLKPVQDGLKRVDEKLQLLDNDRAASRAAIDQAFKFVSEGQQKLADETETLVRALRQPHVRGQWGEMQLRRVVELAGMVEHCDFVEQATIVAESGRLRPDLLVHLPGEKVVVVDSKTPLTAFLDAMDATQDAQRDALLDRHASHVRAHIQALAAKKYADQFARSPDFVVMFLPGESFFSTACQRDPSLIEFAIERGVIPASPTTLITVLKAVAYGWQQERIAQNTAEIRGAGKALYDRMHVLAEHLASMHKHLEGTVGAYNKTVVSLESRVIPSARRLRELGAGTGDDIEATKTVDTVIAQLSVSVGDVH